MPDISMCFNKDCPARFVCYRFMAAPTERRQAYGDFGPEPGEHKCAFFWPLREPSK